MPHQLFLANIPLWCGTSAKGAGPPSARGGRLAEHPPGVGEPLPYHPSVPLAEALGPYAEQVEGALVPHHQLAKKQSAVCCQLCTRNSKARKPTAGS